MPAKRKPLSVVPQGQIDEDTPERFALRTRHLRVNGKPVESKLFLIRDEQARDELREVLP